MSPNADRSPTHDRARRRLIYIFGAILLSMTFACDLPDFSKFWDVEDSAGKVPEPEPLKRHTLNIKNPSGNTFQVTISSPGPPPYPSRVAVTWISPLHSYVSNVTASHAQFQTHNGPDLGGSYVIQWSLPVDPTTGKTDTVSISYDSNPDLTRMDYFDARSNTYPETANQTITRPPSGGGQAAATPASAPAAPADDYYRWRVHRHLYPAGDTAMTPTLCHDWRELLQSEHTFLALRFPVLPPPLAYTQSYTLPLVTGGPGGSLATLEDRSGGPPTTALTAPLEYRPEYHTFLENALPAAPGEHWLALGLVTTPALECASLPSLAQWALELELVLDFGGAPDACADCVLPVYYCYAGQEPPLPLTVLQSVPGAEVTSYQGWGVTCLGPHPLRLGEGAPLELQGMHTAWITPTQTVSLPHSLWNWSWAPLTVTLDYSSTWDLPWGVYSGTADAPDLPLTPIVGPIPLGAYYPAQKRDLWLIATVPAETAWGAGSLVITATDVTSPARAATAWDLLWVGGRVAPPLPPWPQHRIYLPLVLRNSPAP